MQPSVVSKGCFLAGCWRREPQRRLRCVARTQAERCQMFQNLELWVMSRDFSSESSILGRYPGWHGAIWAEIVDSRTPGTPQVWPIHQCQSSRSLFLVCEEISIGIESSDLETRPSPQVVWEVLLYRAAMGIQKWGEVCLGSGQFKRKKRWNLMKVWAADLE